jgi:Fructose-bisphosphate aldolase class-II
VPHEINEQLYSTVDDARATIEALGTGERGRYLTALTFGNVHGVYHPDSAHLRQEILEEIQTVVGGETGKAKPFDLVFHGGSGSSAEDIASAVASGVVKMNIDTDTQYAFTRSIAGHMIAKYDHVLKVDGAYGNKKTYDPRSWGKPAENAMAATAVEAAQTMGSAGRAEPTGAEHEPGLQRRRVADGLLLRSDGQPDDHRVLRPQIAPGVRLLCAELYGIPRAESVHDVADLELEGSLEQEQQFLTWVLHRLCPAARAGDHRRDGPGQQELPVGSTDSGEVDAHVRGIDRWSIVGWRDDRRGSAAVSIDEVRNRPVERRRNLEQCRDRRHHAVLLDLVDRCCRDVRPIRKCLQGIAVLLAKHLDLWADAGNDGGDIGTHAAPPVHAPGRSAKEYRILA